jgi:hypothetical protein
MKLTEHLSLAGANLLNCLCPEENYLPYWHMTVDGNQKAEYQFRPHCNGHNVGRWWNAMLRLHTTTGFAIPGNIEAAMLENTWRMCDNPSGILLDEPEADNADTWYIHSYRETMLTLGLLVAHRGCEAARKQGLRAIEQMRKASRDLTRWDFASCGAGASLRKDGTPCYTHGRAIEGLLCFYEATGEQAALDEAERLAEFHFQNTVDRDGALAAGCGHHTHSYLNTLRGLLQFAALKEQRARLEGLLATYRNAVAAMITPSGFVTHDIGDANARSGGDIASAGDIAHIGLLLWEQFRDPALLDDAERIVRSRLLPAQVREPMPLRPKRNEPGDSFRDLPQRFVGAIGGSVGQVRGQTCVTDFTAAALHSLVEVYRRVIVIEPDTVRVNFHFECEQPGIRVGSHRDRDGACVDVWNDTGRELLIRLPGWAPAPSARLVVNDESVSPDISGGFVRVKPRGARQVRATLRFSLPQTHTKERWRESTAKQETLSFHWLGDEITGVEPCGNYLKPFPKQCGSFLDNQ